MDASLRYETIVIGFDDSSEPLLEHHDGKKASRYKN